MTELTEPTPLTAPTGLRRPPQRYEYVDRGAAIYVDSFATIRREADLRGVPAEAEKLAVRMIHGSGQVDLARDLVIHPGLVGAAREALEAGAPILCDATMVATGVTRSRLPRDNDVVCLLNDPRVPDLASAWGTTRTAAAVSLWEPHLDGAVVAIGNAPTALFHLLELLLARRTPVPETRIVSSDLVRARETADVLAQRMGGEVELDERLREQHLGSLEGRAYDDTWAVAAMHDWSDPTLPVAGGESLQDVHDRMAAVLAEADRSRVTVLVSHGDAIRAAIAHLNGLEPHQSPWVEVPNGAVARLDGTISWLGP